MKKKIIFTTSILIALCFFNIAHASLSINTDVDVPVSCTAVDSDGVAHNYGGSYLAICALEKALENGSVSNAQLSNQYPSLGLFVTSINNVIADPNSQYWSIYQNGSYANSGIAMLPIVAGDTIMFELHDFSDNNLGDQVTLRIRSLVPQTVVGSGPLIDSGEIINTLSEKTEIKEKPSFDTKKAFEFLISQQKEDGSFGEDLYTDWSALALASLQNEDHKINPIIKLIKYLGENKIKGTLLTDYERHAMALMSFGLNPYNINGENYIKKITDSFDGKQFGDIEKNNDDIFALIVLQNAGFDKNEDMMKNTANFIISKQKEDGSWDGNVDMTSAAIEALSFYRDSSVVQNALNKAKEYLKQNQKDNGGFDNVSSTAWAIEGILSLGEKIEDWKWDDKTPLDYLASMQDEDGGIKEDNIDNKIWQSAYVLKALSGKTWVEVMQKFEKPEIVLEIENIINTNDTDVEERKKDVVVEQKIEKKIVKNIKSKIENLGIQNTATVINSINNPEVEKQNETAPIKKSWFKNLLNKIFGI